MPKIITEKQIIEALSILEELNIPVKTYKSFEKFYSRLPNLPEVKEDTK